jgi:indolepyruvate ferredoxin oxidoreductase
MPEGILPDPSCIVPDDEFAMRITGIGGTGVVTVAQVIGTAAMLDGYHVRGLDQIGLSQKAGPVVSDLRLSRTGPTPTNRLGAGQADLLLAFDQLVAASDRGLHTTDPDRTTVVGSTSPTPTGEMITHLDLELPDAETLCKRIAEETRDDARFWADAAAITGDLFGSARTSNVFVVGMAHQAGCLPVGAERIEEAIRLNGVAVEENLAAFRWGRMQIADRDAVERARAARHTSAATVAASRPVALAEPLASRIAALGCAPEREAELRRYAVELVAWGGARRAGEWLDLVERVARTEDERAGGGRRLLAAVAASAFKLLAYKDEYEVARLMTDPEVLQEAREIAGEGGRIAWNLHPPILRALGLERKIALPLWTMPAFRWLARLRFLRGTPFDPFGYAKVRRLERELPEEYARAVDRVLERLDASNLDAAVALAELPETIRGYEDLKLERIARYRDALARAEAAFDGTAAA